MQTVVYTRAAVFGYSKPMTKNEKLILLIAAAAHFFTHFSMLAFPALVMPLSRDLGLPVSEVMGMSFWMYFFYGVLAMGWGWISDRWGHKSALGTGLIVSGIGLIFAGALPSLAVLPLAFALVGAGLSSYHPAGTALISQGIRERGRALGLVGIWGNVGMAMVPFIVGLFNVLIGWRAGLMLVGAASILLGTVSYFANFTIKKGSDEMQTQPIEEGKVKPLFILFACAMIFGGLLFRSFSLTLPAYLEQSLGDISGQMQRLFGIEAGDDPSGAVATLTANIIATFIYIIAVLGQWFGGHVADRVSLKHAYPLFFISALPFLLLLVLTEGWLMIPAAGFFAFFILGMQPIENSLVAYLTPAKWRSIGYGLKFTLVFGAGSFAVKLVSIIERSSGLKAVMKTNFIFIFGVILFALILLAVSRGVTIRHGYTGT
jgi:MFS transporter, FSR family, fosmidomycin resistance protein